MGIVIPCRNEYHYIFNLLDSLLANGDFFSNVYIVVVVNNQKGDEEENLLTLTKLNKSYSFANLKVLNFCEERFFSAKEGVGLARALGFDYLADKLPPNAPYIWLDADCLVAKNFLSEIYHFYRDQKNEAGWVSFEHQRCLDEKQNRAITIYEEFLYSHWQELLKTGTPYAYPSVGSTITCRKVVYENSAGCDRKKMAGEDFYFLQNLIKRGYVYKNISKTKVFPSCRFSNRVPFGTGKKVKEIIDFGYLESYSVECYEAVKYFLDNILAKNFLEDCPYEGLKVFLEEQNFWQKWEKIKKNSKREQELQNFHIWFDGFKVFKLISYLSKNYFPPIRRNL